MSSILGEAWVAIRPETSGFESALTGGLQGPMAKAEGMFSGFGKAATAAVVGVGAAVIGAAAAAVDLAAKYSSSLAVIQVNMGITESAAKAIGDAFLSTGGQVTVSAGEIADAFAPVSRQLELLNGGALTAAQSLDFMTASINAAEATGQPLADVTAALTDVMVAYALPLTDAATATDILTNASLDLNQPIDGIANVVDKLHGKLGETTPSLSDVAALMVDLAQNGVPARQAVGAVSTAITTLLDPTKAAAQAIGDVNLSTLDSTGSFVGMHSIIAQLQPKFEGMTQAQRLQTAAALFGKPAAEAMVGIIQGGADAYDAQAAAIALAGSAADDAAGKTDTLGGAWSRFTNNIKDWLTKAGGPIQKNLTDLVKLLNDKVLPVAQALADWISGTGIPALQQFADWINTHVTPSLHQFADWIVKTGIPALQQFADWIGKHVIPSLQQFWGWIVQNVLPVLQRFRDWVINVGLPMMEKFGQWVWDHLISPLGTLAKTTIPPLLGAIGSVFTALNNWKVLIPILAAVAGAFLTWKIVNDVIAMVQTIGDDIGEMVDGVKKLGLAAWWVIEHAKMLAESISFHVQYALLWVGEKAGRIADFAVILAAWVVTNVGMMADTVIKVATITAIWVAQKVEFIAGCVARAAAWALSMAGMVAATEAAEAPMAVAWGVILGPIALVVAAVSAVVVGMKWILDHPTGKTDLAPFGANPKGTDTDRRAATSSAAGGYYPARVGGVYANIAEGGEGESVVPDSQRGAYMAKWMRGMKPSGGMSGAGAGGGSVSIVQHFNNNSGSMEEMRSLVKQGNRELISALQAGRR